MRHPCLRLALFQIALLLACTIAVGAQEVGPEMGEPITVLVPLTPRLLDPQQNVQPAITRWLTHVANRANVRMRLQPAGFERRIADSGRSPHSCILGIARVPERETMVRWLDVIRRDRIVIIAAANDPFSGPLEALMKLADTQIASPTGIYRDILEKQGVRYTIVDDQRALARMVAVGRVRFGIVISGTLDAPEVASLPVRIVGELPFKEYWFTCSRDMSDALATRLVAALNDRTAEHLRQLALDSDPASQLHAGTPTQ
ncbi:hypothetical protein CHU95_18150 [Niveispirillum lacus]|uniref:Solute-binding protein family 3/N-terminal domain-containing protein n=1 Tax=Niveispirillum lacus TaxID=1981099 RepID=A0A255YTX8_9PROT|nr:hypothetical protein [Niveispirillum lacus]OYQ32687.1 hypothetical protein CHU95_18150 [Niveispirillum lacus]